MPAVAAAVVAAAAAAGAAAAGAAAATAVAAAGRRDGIQTLQAATNRASAPSLGDPTLSTP